MLELSDRPLQPDSKFYLVLFFPEFVNETLKSYQTIQELNLEFVCDQIGYSVGSGKPIIVF